MRSFELPQPIKLNSFIILADTFVNFRFNNIYSFLQAASFAKLLH
jgi:hypothetical protein